ncbi:MAG: response regulator [Limnospira sp.]
MKLLLIDDDEQLAEELVKLLKVQNYVVDVAADGEEGWNYIQTFDYNLVLLDVMLPKLDGITLCRKLRSQGYQMPILLLTARDTCQDKVLGLDAGADDYLVKPIVVPELVARIRALLRRGVISTPPVLSWGSVRLNPAHCEISYNGSILPLTPKEYGLLELLVRSPCRVFNYDTIIEHLWSGEDPPSDNTVRAHVKSLRTKLKAAGAPSDTIENVYGLGYRIKSPGPPPAPKSASETSVLEAVSQIWDNVREKTLARVQVIQDLAILNPQDIKIESNRREAYQEAHKLAGSLGTFGFARGSQLARKIEYLLSGDKPLNPYQHNQLQKWTNELYNALQKRPREDRNESLSPVPSPHLDGSPSLLIVDDDTLLSEQIAQEAKIRGMEAKTAPSVGVARAMLVESTPSLILLDLNFPSPDEDGFTLLEDLAYHRPEIPVVVLSVRSSFIDRLTVCRLGSRAFLQKPMPTEQILDLATEVLQNNVTRSRVMAIDDDPQILELLTTLLSPFGLQVETLSTPRKFWEALELSTPDLLILDVEMPHYNGIELCQVIRNEPRWRYLPILILTSYSDPETISRVFSAGADDFISKPVVGPELIARLFNRLHRSRLWRNLAEVDTLTGVANRQKSSQDINRLLRMAGRQKQPLCFAILDLDHFKEINDRHGHATGDWVLHRFGELLQRVFRKEDVVGRWGGEEFAVAMYGTSREDGTRRLETVLEQWGLEVLILEGTPFSVTFSAGVAQYPDDGRDLQSLYRSADVALYRAKETGRNQVRGSNSGGREIDN